MPRKRWIFLVAAVAMLAIAVPVAWATFNDVPPSNPFYADINAIQGAGVTQGCGGGNFCPNDNITRQAEAAFVHRVAPRTAFFEGNYQTLDPAGTDLGSVTIDVGGVAGGTQFVVLNAAVNTFIENTTGCPCDTGYVLTDDSFNPVSADTGFNLNDTLGSDVGDGAVGDDTGEVQAVVPVSTGGPHTFHVASFAEAGTGTVIGEAQITATTAAFGSTGGNTLNAQVAGGANHRSIPASVTAKLAGK